MQLYPEHFHHLYNRTNNKECAFREERNYHYFIKKYKLMIAPSVKTLAYILMPTHFHFFVQIKTKNIEELKRAIGNWQSSYAHAVNNAYKRHGSLFQNHTKAIVVDDDSYFVTLISYIHQNAVRSNLVKRIQDWPFSSYPDLAGLRNGTLPDKNTVLNLFGSSKEFVKHSEEMLNSDNRKYWI